MLVSATCGGCGATVEKDPRMMPHFMKLKAKCRNCGTLVELPYKPGKGDAANAA